MKAWIYKGSRKYKRNNKVLRIAIIHSVHTAINQRE